MHFFPLLQILHEVFVDLLLLIRIKAQISGQAFLQCGRQGHGGMLQEFEHLVMEKKGRGDASGEASKKINQDDPENGFPVACHDQLRLFHESRIPGFSR